MSQAKVDKRKEEKKNREKIMRKEKAGRAFAWLIVIVICAGIVGWLGYSIYQSANSSNGPERVIVDTTALDDYLDTLPQE